LSEEKKVSRRNYLKYAGGAVVVVAGAAAGAYYLSMPTAPPSATSSTSAGGPAAPPKPSQLTIACQAGARAGSFWVSTSPFTSTTGIKVVVEEIAGADQYTKELADLTTGAGTYDILEFSPSWVADFHPYLLPLNDYIKNGNAQWEDFVKGYRVNFCWPPGTDYPDGTTLGLPLDGDVWFLYYRKDWFDDPAEQTAFKAKYGYPLGLPQTYEQFNDIAGFFQRPPNRYGCALYLARPESNLEFQCRFAAYGGYYFDENGKAAVNSDAGVHALTLLKWLVDNASPPGVVNYGYDEYATAFEQGKAAMEINWGGFAHSTIIPGFDCTGHTGYALAPGGMVNGSLNVRGLMAHGYALGVNVACKYPYWAYKLAELMTSPSTLRIVNVQPGTVTDPTRYSVFKAGVADQLGPGPGPEYFAVSEESLALGYPEIGCAHSEAFRTVLDREVSGCLAGNKTPKDALDTVANEWNSLLTQYNVVLPVKPYPAGVTPPTPPFWWWGQWPPATTTSS
jgi:multiple sugar transport system substrate-binding protein